MHATAWVASHLAALVSIQWLAPRAGGICPNWLLYGIPLSVGVVQWAFLSKYLRWHGRHGPRLQCPRSVRSRS